tara:strand:+ start:2463 stop:2669 length:207 start_codon:yes stop_codon:yes gene_type:complete
MKKGILDRVLEKVISRKLFVFIVATNLLLLADLSSDVWGMIAVVYIGGQAAVDFAKEWKHGQHVDLNS